MSSPTSTNIVRTVRMNDGRLLVGTLKVADYVAFERKFNIDIPTSTNRVEYWAFLTWASLKRQGDVTEEFDVFLDAIDEFVGDEEPNGDEAPKEESVPSSGESPEP